MGYPVSCFQTHIYVIKDANEIQALYQATLIPLTRYYAESVGRVKANGLEHLY